MKFDEIESHVLRNLNPDEQMTPQDKNCWYALRGLYQEYRSKNITREQAKKMKQEIAENHARICRLHNQYFASVSQTQEFIRRASRYRYDIIHLETKEEILDMILKMVSEMLAEDSLERIIRKKLEDKQE